MSCFEYPVHRAFPAALSDSFAIVDRWLSSTVVEYVKNGINLVYLKVERNEIEWHRHKTHSSERPNLALPTSVRAAPVNIAASGKSRYEYEYRS